MLIRAMPEILDKTRCKVKFHLSMPWRHIGEVKA